MILLLTELVLLTSVLSVTLISRLNTILNAVVQYPAKYSLPRACKAGHVVEVTHTLFVTSRVYWMSQPNALTQARQH